MRLRLLVLPVALMPLALGCDSKPSQPAAKKIQTRKAYGTDAMTQNVLKLQDALASGYTPADTTIQVADPLSQAADANRTLRGKIGGIAVQQAIQIRNAQSIMDPKPLTYEEFMAEIIKKGQPDGIQLPQLPYYQEYAWDEAGQQLVVVEDLQKKADFAKQKP